MKRTLPVVIIALFVIMAGMIYVSLDRPGEKEIDRSVYYSVEDIQFTEELTIDGVQITKSADYLNPTWYSKLTWCSYEFKEECYTWGTFTFKIHSDISSTKVPTICTSGYKGGVVSGSNYLSDFFNPIEDTTIVINEGVNEITLHYLLPKNGESIDENYKISTDWVKE